MSRVKVGDVDLPCALVEALHQDRLVTFVGAGASRQAGLPDFLGLVRKMARASGFRTVRKTESLDVVVGEMERSGLATQSLLESALAGSKKTIEPAAIHHAITALYRQRPPRLVTTNFDRLLEQADSTLSDRCFVAPALPLPDQFEGLVYLHGRLPQNEGTVLSDADFSHAYITSGWARRFLRGLLLKYTVLFVGYSLNDPLVRYFLRGLVKDEGLERLSRLYSLVAGLPGEATQDWQNLGVTPVFYPHTKDHGALTEALRIWSDFESLSVSEQAARVERLASEPTPPASESDQNLLELACMNRALSAKLWRTAQGAEWVAWAKARGFFSSLRAANWPPNSDLVHFLLRDPLSDAGAATLEALLDPPSTVGLPNGLGAWFARKLYEVLKICRRAHPGPDGDTRRLGEPPGRGLGPDRCETTPRLADRDGCEARRRACPAASINRPDPNDNGSP